MTLLQLRVKTNARIVAKGLQDLNAEIPKIGRLQIYNTMVRARNRLRKKPTWKTYPIPWDSFRQKIKVIMLLKQSGGLPYRSKGDYVNSFQIIKQKDGYDLVNPLEKAVYIGGDEEGKGQSRIFKNRYPLIRTVVDEEMEKLPSAVVQHLQIVINEKGFGP